MKLNINEFINKMFKPPIDELYPIIKILKDCSDYKEYDCKTNKYLNEITVTYEMNKIPSLETMKWGGSMIAKDSNYWLNALVGHSEIDTHFKSWLEYLYYIGYLPDESNVYVEKELNFCKDISLDEYLSEFFIEMLKNNLLSAIWIYEKNNLILYNVINIPLLQHLPEKSLQWLLDKTDNKFYATEIFKISCEKGYHNLFIYICNLNGTDLNSTDLNEYSIENKLFDGLYYTYKGGNNIIINTVKNNKIFPTEETYIALAGACRGGHVHLITSLLEKDKEYWDQKPFGINHYTWPLNDACGGGHIEVAKLMINLGAELNNFYHLSFACKSGNIELVKLLLELNIFDEYSIQFACEYNHLDIIELLILKCNNNYNYGLYGACKSGNLLLIQRMIELGANDFNYGFKGACSGGNLNLVKKMIEYGADDYNEGFINACTYGHDHIVEYLLKIRYLYSIDILNKSFILAYEYKYIKIIKKILKSSTIGII